MSVWTQRLAPGAALPSGVRAWPLLSASRLLPLLVLAVTFAVFNGVGTFGFVRWDDALHVTGNPWLHPVSAIHIAHFWRTSYQGLYIPLSYTVYSLIALIAREPSSQSLDPHVFHVVNLALHLLNVLLVFTLLKKLVPNAWAAAAGALLFGIHPVQVESVAWVSELRGLLSALFALLALWQYLEFRESAGWGWYGAATFAFALALLAKPSAVAVPLIALSLAVWGLGQPWKRCLPTLTVWAAMALVCVWANHTAQSVPPELSLPPGDRLLVAGDALALHLGHMVWPTNLGIDYGRSPSVVLAHPWGHWTWLVPMLLGTCLWMGRRHWPLLCASGAIFLFALLPVLGLVPFAFQAASTVADRYAYLAMLGPALGAAWLLARVPRRALPLSAGLAAGLLLLLGLQSALQASFWQDDFSLFSRALAVNPHSWIADNDLGTALWERGRMAQAVPLFQDSLRENPRQEDAWNNLGAAYYSEGRWGEAEAALQRTFALDPGCAAAANNLGLVYWKERRPAQAARLFQIALRLDPGYALARTNLESAVQTLRH